MKWLVSEEKKKKKKEKKLCERAGKRVNERGEGGVCVCV